MTTTKFLDEAWVNLTLARQVLVKKKHFGPGLNGLDRCMMRALEYCLDEVEFAQQIAYWRAVYGTGTTKPADLVAFFDLKEMIKQHIADRVSPYVHVRFEDDQGAKSHEFLYPMDEALDLYDMEDFH